MMGEQTEFQRRLTELLNETSQENESDTPDFVLAEYLVGCLEVFNATINRRESWYGREHELTTKLGV